MYRDTHFCHKYGARFIVTTLSHLLTKQSVRDSKPPHKLCCLARDKPVVKVSWKSVHYFLSDLAYGQTSKYDQKHNRPGDIYIAYHAFWKLPIC